MGRLWAKSYIQRIITSRTVIGEYQPMRGGNKDGTPIPNYYPAVVDEKIFHAAQAARSVRKMDNGGFTPSHSHSNLFSHTRPSSHLVRWLRSEWRQRQLGDAV